MIRAQIPNFLTLCNMMCGIVAALVAITGFLPLSIAAFFIFVAAFFDFADGFAARALHAYSDIGKELDSMADLISFGFAPAAIAYAIMQHSIFGTNITGIDTISSLHFVYIISPFILVLFSAIRLAKFNVDTRQTSSFIGLPTPANALFFAGLVFVDITAFNPLVFMILILIFSFLLVSNLPMFSLKTSSFSFRKHPMEYSFVSTAFLLILLFQLQAISLIIILYIFVSFSRKLFFSKQQ